MTGRERLSEAQRRVLSRMANGEEVWTTGGGNSHAFWHNNLRDRAPSSATLFVLQKNGWIANYYEPLSGKKYRITPAGRAALSTGGSDQ
jgi:hypothetical protein